MKLAAAIAATTLSVLAAANCYEGKVYCFDELSPQGKNLAIMEISDKNQATYENKKPETEYTDVDDWTYLCTNSEWDMIQIDERITGSCKNGDWKHNDNWVRHRDDERYHIKILTMDLVVNMRKVAEERGWEGFRIDMTKVAKGGRIINPRL